MTWTKIGLYVSIGITGILILGFLCETLGLFGGSGSSVDMDATVYLLCGNPDCRAETTMKNKEYFKKLQENAGNMMMGPMMGPTAIECPECGEISAYKAEKCEECGAIFVPDYQNMDDYPDRCPECGYSKMEEKYDNQ